MSDLKGIAPPRAIRAAGLFLCAWLVSACGSPPPRVDAQMDPAVGSIRELLVREYDARVTGFPETAARVRALGDQQVLVFIASEPRTPILSMDPAVARALRAYVRRGGSLVLLGYAARMVYELGLESAPPDRFEPYRWGLDQHTLLGDYRYGIRMVSARAPELVRNLEPEKDRPHVYLLGGGQPAEVQSCHWEGYQPRGGEVLAQLSRERDGEPADLDPVVLGRWTEGLGTVLAYGSLPEPWRRETAIAANAEQFLRNALEVVHGSTPDSVALCVSPWGVESPAERALTPLGGREIPGQVLASHWGWQVALNYLHEDRTPIAPAAILDEIALPSWRAGADLLELHLPDMDRGYPLEWRGDDRLKRPRTYWGSSFWPEWSAEPLRALAAEAHARSMLVQTWLAPPPVRSASVTELLAALRWFGRELLDLRRLGAGALDGIGVEGWFRDPRGLTLAALQDFHPGSYVYDSGDAVGSIAGAVPVIDANRGRPLGLNASGISEIWRPGLLDLGFPAAMLDSRSRRPSLRLWGNDHALGGGSYGDWIVTQANDFVRHRLGQGPSLWWQSFNPATMDPSTLAYVHGVSMDPIKAAVAGRLWATGAGGYREVLAESVAEIQSGFGAEVSLEASTHFLQNNHVRLHGIGGPLLLDPRALARFRVGSGARVVASELMRTTMFGGRPHASELRSEEIDFLGSGRRGESGYGEAVSIRGAERGSTGFPAVLAREAAPRWPQRVDLHFFPGLGLFELEVVLRGVAGGGVLELRRDGELVQVIGFSADASQRHVLPFHVARSGERLLSLEVVDGGVAVESLRLVRRQDTAAEGSVAEPAGHRAALQEWSASSYHSDRTRITTLADLPGFLVSVDYLRFSRSLRVQRSFGFAHHRTLVESTDGEGPEKLRGPFILASDVAGIPDLAVVPIEMARYDHFTLSDEGLVLNSQPRSQESLRLGFLFLRDTGAGSLPYLQRIFEEIQNPRVFELAASGSATLTSDLPIPWVRAVRAHNPWGTPYAVRENGWWIHRGGQPSREGGEWLRLYQIPGDEVRVVTGPALLRRTRPGPGSLHTVALKDVRPDGATVRVLQIDPLVSAPSVIMAEPFDEVLLDGRPWSYFDGSTVYLPKADGDYRVETRRQGSAPAPRLVRTRARVLACSYDPASRILTVTTRSSDGRPGELPYTAVIAGPEPISTEGCTRVVEEEFSYRQDADRNRAGAVVVRFHPGTMRIHYAPDR